MARVDDRQTVSLQAKFAIDDFQGAPGGDDEAVRSACQTRGQTMHGPICEPIGRLDVQSEKV